MAVAVAVGVTTGVGVGVAVTEAAGFGVADGTAPRTTSPGISFSPTPMVIATLPRAVSTKFYTPATAGADKRPKYK